VHTHLAFEHDIALAPFREHRCMTLLGNDVGNATSDRALRASLWMQHPS